MNRRNRNRGSLQFAVGREQLIEGTEGPASELAPNRVSPSNVLIDHAQQTQRLTLLLEFLVHAGVISPERAHADYSDVDGAARIQGKGLGRLVAIGDRL